MIREESGVRVRGVQKGKEGLVVHYKVSRRIQNWNKKVSYYEREVCKNYDRRLEKRRGVQGGVSQLAGGGAGKRNE